MRALNKVIEQKSNSAKLQFEIEYFLKVIAKVIEQKEKWITDRVTSVSVIHFFITGITRVGTTSPTVSSEAVKTHQLGCLP